MPLLPPRLPLLTPRQVSLATRAVVVLRFESISPIAANFGHHQPQRFCPALSGTRKNSEFSSIHVNNDESLPDLKHSAISALASSLEYIGSPPPTNAMSPWREFKIRFLRQPMPNAVPLHFSRRHGFAGHMRDSTNTRATRARRKRDTADRKKTLHGPMHH